MQVSSADPALASAYFQATKWILASGDRPLTIDRSKKYADADE
jgi:hypothetical protein